MKISPQKRKAVAATRKAPVRGIPLVALEKLTIPPRPSSKKSTTETASPQNNILTASRMNCMMKCLRQHFWAYEIGLRRKEESVALRIGSAWARGMEARWNGLGYEEALNAAVDKCCDLDEVSIAIVSALLAAYYEYYGDREEIGNLKPEVQFRNIINIGTVEFTAEGKMDGLGEIGGAPTIIESKTTSDSLAPDSDYWLRLSFNIQVYQYILAAREKGIDVEKVFYDVTRKPSIRPKEIEDLDPKGLKIVLDTQGQRVYKKDGEPRQTGDKEKGFYVKAHIETPDEFCQRLYRDALSRPDFYFARREIPIIDQQLDSFKRQREAIGGMIMSLRRNETTSGRDPDAWPRNVSEHTCNFCSYKTFCLQNISVDLTRPPEGFSIQPLNPELDKNYADTDSTETNAAS